MKRLFFILILWFINSEVVNATTYYTKSGSTDPENVNNWTDETGGEDLGASPADFTNAADIFVIEAGDSYTTATGWAVLGSVRIDGTLNIDDNSSVNDL